MAQGSAIDVERPARRRAAARASVGSARAGRAGSRLDPATGRGGRRVAERVEYAVRLLERLRASDTEIHLVVAPAAERALGSDLERVLDLATYRYDHDNQAARIASGSYLTEGMAVVPCDADVLSAIGMGLASDLAPPRRGRDAQGVAAARARAHALVGIRARADGAPDRPPGLTVVTLSGDVDAAVGSILDQLAGSTA